MADIIAFRRRKLSEKHRGKSLCREGFHKWGVTKDRIFDVKAGKLVTEYRCSRCGKIRVQTR